MLESAALVGFAGVSDLDRARHFYGDQLGLPLRDETPFALVAEAAARCSGSPLWTTLHRCPTPFSVGASGISTRRSITLFPVERCGPVDDSAQFVWA
jgi:catechol 2,3-dioxygenase-like lactoylglutathione lyase family enzyme